MKALLLKGQQYSVALHPWQYLAVAGGSVALGLAAPPTNVWPFAWIALIGLWLCALEVTPRRGFFLGWLLGTGYNLILLQWLLGIHPLEWMGIPWWPSLGIAVGLWALISAFEGLTVGLWSMGMAFVAPRCSPPLRIMFGVGLWLGIHWFWHQGDLAFPWADLALTQTSNLWVLQGVSLSGSAGLTGLVIAVNGLCAESIRAKSGRYMGIATVLCGLWCSYGLWRLSTFQETESPLALGIVQGNISQQTKWASGSLNEIIRTYAQGYIALSHQRVAAVIIPETAIPVYWERALASSLGKALAQEKTPLFLGAFDQRQDQLSNTLFAIDGKGVIQGTYDKDHLVPLGEQIPYKQIFGLIIQKLSPLKQQLADGASNQVFNSPLGRVAAGICYDSAFGEGFRTQVAQGARWIVSVTNDAWFGPAMPAQHHGHEILRAVETDRWLVRASNTGTSGSIDPTGKPGILTQRDQYRAFVTTIHPRNSRTLYVEWGDWLTPLLVSSAVLIGISTWQR
ncbi:MAG: apolipoprotein N-acyltransferase [Gloeobacterales cyanobacterium]